MMFNNFFKWFITKNQQKAFNTKQKLAILYAIVGWNCFAVCFYSLIHKQIPDNSAERRKFYKQLTGTSETSNVYQISGFTLSNNFIDSSNVNADLKAQEFTKIDENL